MTDPLPAISRNQPQTLIIGPATDAQFASLVNRVSSHVGEGRTERLLSIESLFSEREHSEPPHHADLVIVLHTWPEQYTRAQILNLINRFPLARLVVCYGPWCDSDGRTRGLWPFAARVPIAGAECRLLREFSVLRGEAEPLPLTASRAEAFQADYSPRQRMPRSELSIEVRTPDPAIRDCLEALLCAAGVSCHTTPRQSTNLVIWDVDPWHSESAEEVTNCHLQRPELPVLALAGFPRAEEVEQMRRCGIGRVVTKTASAQQLLGEIESLSAEIPACAPGESPQSSLRIHP